MTFINGLPGELLLRVFNYVDKQSLKNCTYVARKWESRATQAYYDVTLTAIQIHKIKTLFEGNLPNQDDFLGKLKWTKKLKIEKDVLDALKTAFEQ